MSAETFTWMNLTHELLVAAAVLPALLSAAAALPKRRRMLADLGPWSALPALAVSLWTPPGTQVELPWLLLSGVLGVDSDGRLFLFFTALLWLLSGVFARGYLSGERRAEFFLFYLLAMSGNFGLILAQDFVTFYLFFAWMSFSSYGLVIFNRDAEALRAGIVYIALVVLGELLLFAGLVVLASDASGLGMQQAGRHGLSRAAFPLLLLGFGIKAGALPLHVWLPLAHPVAPTPASAVLSGAMIKAGLIGWLRFLPLGSTAEPDWGAVCMGGGLAAAFYGVVAGIAQQNPKTVLAYSSISQMGLMTIGIGAALLSPENWPAVSAAVTLYALHHGLAKGTLFLGVAVPSPAYSGVARWFRQFGLAVAAASLAGAPWTSGALAKTALKSSLDGLPAARTEALGLLLPLAAAGTTLLMARFLFLVWRGRRSEEKITLQVWTSWGLLVAATASAAWLWAGVPGWIAQTLDLSTSAFALAPIAAGGLLAWIAWKAAAGRPFPAFLRIPAGDLLAAVLWLWRLGPPVSFAAVTGRFRQLAQAIRRAEPVFSYCGRLATAALAHGERRLRDWTVAGAVVLLLFLMLLASLAED